MKTFFVVQCLVLPFSEPVVTFTTPLKDQTVTEKESVTLECEVSKPNQKVVFYQNGKEIIIDKKHFKQSSKGAVHKLLIADSVLDDAGKYSAKLGDQTTECNLTVKGMGDFEDQHKRHEFITSAVCVRLTYDGTEFMPLV